MILVGKILGYYLNAYQDAKIAQELWDFADGKIKKNGLSKRAKIFAKSKQVAAASAYTYYYWNGLYDYWWALLFEKLWFVGRNKEFIKGKAIVDHFKKKLKLRKDFSEIKRIRLLKPLILLLMGRPRSLDVKTMIWVQEENKRSNFEEYDKVQNRQFDNLKLKAMKQISDLGVDINCVAAILKSASFWDDLFILFLKLRFSVK